MMDNADIQDIQDRIGYVDTGSSKPQPSTTETLQHPTVVTSSTSHITIKEPKPLRQVHILNPNNNHEAKKRPTVVFNNNEGNKPSYYQPQQQQQPPKPIIKKSVSMETGNYHYNNVPPATTATTAASNYYYDSNNNKRSPPENNKTPFVNYPTSSAPNMTTNNEELRDRMVHTLRDLAEMLNHWNLDAEAPVYYGQRQQGGPRPTPSKSDPSLSHYPPLRRSGSSRKKYIPTSSPPETTTNRQQYNKSADATINYGSGRQAYHYDNDYNDYYPYYEAPLPPQQDMVYDDYYLDQPYPYAPPNPQQQRPIYGRPRRKSYTNLRDEDMYQQQRLSRKNSRGNMRQPPRHVMYDPYLQQPERPYHYYPQYSPDSYYHH